MNTMKTETRTREQVLLDQQLALGVYLQALLRPPAVAEVPAGPAGEAAPAPAPVPAPTPVADARPAIAAPVAEGEPSAPGPRTAACPDWARGEFQCLLFRVAGLRLALPLARLGGVLPWDGGAVTPMPGHQPWFLGLQEHLGRQVRLIDVARVVLPPDRRDALAAADGGRLGKVILIGDGDWGLACEAVDEVVTLSAEAVKWRSRAGSRPWLAGTVIEEMCALIDADAFAAMLAGSGPAEPMR